MQLTYNLRERLTNNKRVIKMIQLTLGYHSDYRTGTKIWIKDEKYIKEDIHKHDDESDTEDTFSSSETMLGEIDLETSDKYTVYVVCGDGCLGDREFKIIDLDDRQEAKKVLQHIFSEVHDCQPFVVTGHTSAYKEEGHYPDALPQYIHGQDLLSQDVLDAIEDYNLFYCAGVVVHESSVVDFLQIMPLF